MATYLRFARPKGFLNCKRNSLLYVLCRARQMGQAPGTSTIFRMQIAFQLMRNNGRELASVGRRIRDVGGHTTT